MKNKIALLSILALSATTLSGCVGAAVGAGATVGVAAAQEGGVTQAATDAAIRLQIADAWFKHSAEMFGKLSMTVKEGRVLVTGSVPTPDMRVEAVRLAWQANGVRQVINEVRVDGGDGVSGYVSDTWVTGNIKGRILLDKEVQSINYSIETVGGVVYLMGIAQDQAELNRVIDYARNTKYVKNVVSYVRLRGEPVPGSQTPPTSRAPAPVTYGNDTNGVANDGAYSNAPAPADGGYNDVYAPPAHSGGGIAPVESYPLNSGGGNR
jgi:osmotically-inducible protein OsmY